MNYTEDEFFQLIQAVEDQNGQHLDKVCKTQDYEYTGTKPHGRGPLKACGNSSLLEIPYDALNKAGDEVGVHPIEVCAVEDEVGRWPRFGGDRFAGPDYYVKPWDA